jgi:ornithine cyclodeaminase/alanine dehydrogenase-like protein (mu-crystallin family)
MTDRTPPHPNGMMLVLTAADVRTLLPLPDCIDAVQRVLALHATGGTPPPGVLGFHVPGGGFHIKAAAAPLGRFYFVAKTNGNFPGNPARNGLPSIQGVLVLCDAADGRVLAVMDSMEITALRTAAATAVAARHLARPESAVATVVGCGSQGRVQLRALVAVLPLESVHAFDTDGAAVKRFAEELTAELGIPVHAASDLRAAALQSDVVVTCTPARRALLGPEDVRAGTLIAAVGADNPEKQELDPGLFPASTVVVDVLDQCVAIGDLHHAIDAGIFTPERVHAELGQVAAGLRPGRRSASEVIVFDSTGTALQDVAAAALVYERAVAEGRGLAVALAG